MKRRAAAAAALVAGLLCPLTCNASAPAAWQALEAKTRAACLKAAGLKNAKVTGAPVQFQQHMLLTIRGTWRQAHMKGKTGTVYCLHPFPDGRPEIAEAMPAAEK